MRWLMTKNRVALSISLSLSTDLLRHPASDTLYFQISQSWSSVESFIQHQGWLEDSRIPQGWVDVSDNFLVSVDSMWRSDTLWDSEGGEAGKFSRLCEVPSRQSTCHCFPASKTRESSLRSHQTWPTVRTGYISNCCPVRTTFFYILLWNTPGKDSKFWLKNTPGWWV